MHVAPLERLGSRREPPGVERAPCATRKSNLVNLINQDLRVYMRVCVYVCVRASAHLPFVQAHMYVRSASTHLLKRVSGYVCAHTSAFIEEREN